METPGWLHITRRPFLKEISFSLVLCLKIQTSQLTICLRTDAYVQNTFEFLAIPLGPMTFLFCSNRTSTKLNIQCIKQEHRSSSSDKDLPCPPAARSTSVARILLRVQESRAQHAPRRLPFAEPPRPRHLRSFSPPLPLPSFLEPPPPPPPPPDLDRTAPARV